MDKNGVLSMRDVMNYEYCPRITYFEHVLREPQDTTIKEFKGREKDRAYTPYSKRLKMVRAEKASLPPLARKYKLWLYSPEKNFQTVLDCLLYNDDERIAFPLQFKNTFAPRVVYRTQKLQLYGEAFLVKELLGYEVSACFLKFLKDNQSIKIPVFYSNLVEFELALNAVNDVIARERLPEPTPYKKRCVDCCFTKQCLRA